MDYSIILLAAGSSVRMGEKNKLLLPFRGSTLVEYCTDKLVQLNAAEIIVVTGHEPEKIQNQLQDRPFIFSHNPLHKSGMTSSIQQGVRTCKSDTGGVLICQSDMPELRIVDLKKIIKTIKVELPLEPKLIVAPSIGKRIGNPVFFSRHYFESLLAHEEPNGCKSLIKNNLEYLTKVPLDNSSAFSDVDTAEDYQRYK